MNIFETREWIPATYPGSPDGQLESMSLEVRPPDLESDAFQGIILARFQDAVAKAAEEPSLETLARAEHSPESIREVAAFLAGRVRVDGRPVSAGILMALAGTDRGSPHFWTWIQDQVFGSFIDRCSGDLIKKKRPKLSREFTRIRVCLTVIARTVAASSTELSTLPPMPTENSTSTTRDASNDTADAQATEPTEMSAPVR